MLLLLYVASAFGFGMRIAQLSTIPADVFAGPHLGAILGVVGAGGGLGGAIGPYLAGMALRRHQQLSAGVPGRLCRRSPGSAVAAWIAARPTAGAAEAPRRPARSIPALVATSGPKVLHQGAMTRVDVFRFEL